MIRINSKASTSVNRSEWNARWTGEEPSFAEMKKVITLHVRIARGLAVGLTTLMVASASNAQECEDRVARLVRSLGVERAEYSDISIERVSSGEGGLQGYKAWVRMEFCRGHLVIDRDTQCLSSQEYVTGACRIRGVPNY